jgi:hypothetical protein
VVVVLVVVEVFDDDPQPAAIRLIATGNAAQTHLRPRMYPAWQSSGPDV